MEIDKKRAKSLIDSIVLHLTLYERKGASEELRLVYNKLDELEDEIDNPG